MVSHISFSYKLIMLKYMYMTFTKSGHRMDLKRWANLYANKHIFRRMKYQTIKRPTQMDITYIFDFR